MKDFLVEQLYIMLSVHDYINFYGAKIIPQISFVGFSNRTNTQLHNDHHKTFIQQYSNTNQEKKMNTYNVSYSMAKICELDLPMELFLTEVMPPSPTTHTVFIHKII